MNTCSHYCRIGDDVMITSLRVMMMLRAEKRELKPVNSDLSFPRKATTKVPTLRRPSNPERSTRLGLFCSASRPGCGGCEGVRVWGCEGVE